MDQKVLDKLVQLTEKYESTGQDVSSFLEGLYHTSFLTYWDYIRLDTLLSLQNPKTDFEDEEIFITYHQITELYFKLMINELNAIGEKDVVDEGLFIKRLTRLNRYARQLSSSISMMTEGIDQDQFLKFRMALLPSSGFQSVQFRILEMASTDMINLVGIQSRDKITQDATSEELYEHIYWKYGATELKSGDKTLTLKQFEEKYTKRLLECSRSYQRQNLYKVFRSYYKSGGNNKILELLKEFDSLINIQWRLAHFKSAIKHLKQDPQDLNSTGGTNWKNYLPPRFQKIIFFPELWTEEERANWGRKWLLLEEDA